MKKRLLALLLALTLLVSCLPHVVLAEGVQSEGQEQETTEGNVEETTTEATAAIDLHDHSDAHVCEDCEDANVVWQKWDNPNALPNTTGHYYLATDVTISAYADVKSTADVVLCLNGYTVDAQQKCCIFRITGTAKVTVADCTAYTDSEGNYVAGQLTGGQDKDRGATIHVADSAIFQMFGGKLTAGENTQDSTAMGWSGSIHARGNASVYLKDCEISGNHTTAEGGAICLRETGATGDTAATAYCENVTFMGNSADRKGGVIFLNSAKNSATFKNCTFEDNYSKGSAGVIYSNYGTVTVENSSFKGNYCTNSGGAIQMNGGKLTVIGSTFDGTNAEGKDNATNGGAVYLSTAADMNVKSSTFTGYKVSNLGSVVFIKESNTRLIMESSEISGNSGKNGTIYVQTGGTFKMTAGVIKNNTVTGKGGGIYINGDGATGYIDGGEITGNTANYGGAIYLENAKNILHLRGGKLTGNTATTWGGGIYCSASATFNTKGTPEVTGNIAASSANNVWLGTDAVVTIGEMGEGTAKIGLTVDGSNMPRYVSTDLGSKDYAAYFFSDNSYREIVEKDGKLYVQNATNHQHCDCVNIGGDNCDHTTNVWIAWEKTNALPTTSGYYYLTADVKTSDRQSVTGNNDVHLCLNGHTVDGNQKIIYHTKETASLTITDCTAHTDEQGNYVAGQLTNASDTNVGAIYAENGSVTMFGGKLTNNRNTQTSTATGWSGGAIHARGSAQLLLVGVELSDNHTTAEGGAICLRANAQAVLENCTFKNNAADRQGGAIFVAGKTNALTLKDCTFEGNTAGTQGGAIYSKGNTLTVTEGSFENNQATNNGGAIQIEAGTTTLENVTFIGNTGANGGAIRIVSGAEAAITGSTFTGNHATASGGAISAADSNITLQSNKINENISDGTAGALIFAGKDKVLTLVSGEFKDNTAAAAGGAMLVQSYAKLDMKDGTFTGNTSTGGDGGAMYISTNCTGVIENCTVTGNTAQKYAGGIMLFGSNVVMNNGLISGNTAANGAGVTGRSGIRTEDGNEIRDVGAVFTMNGGKITENVASTGDGGGLQFAGDNCAATINGGEISGNTASSGGGIIAMTNAVITINDGKISGNTASRNGGGLFMSFTSVLNINGGEISGNKASNGGGIYLYGASATLTGGKITKNTAKDNSGGIGGGGCTQNGVRYRSVLNMKDVTIAENTGTNYGGIGLVMTDIQMESGTVITGNYAQKAVGGMVIMTDSTMKMTGGIISYNTAAEAANGGLYISSRSTLTMTGGTICYNQCKNDGGGVYLQQSTGYFYGGSIVGNRSNEGNGGGMRVGGSTVYLYGTSIKDNYAKASGGGVIAARFKNTGENKDYMPYITIDGSTISGNKSDGPAGGMVLQAPGKTVFKSGVIENNESAGNGGGIYVSTNHTFEMSGGEIRNNKANQGAGVYHLASIGNYTGGKITGNVAVKNGGGMVMTGASNVTMKDFTIVENEGWTAGGFILNNQNVKFTAENCEFSRNKAVEAHAGAFYIVWGVTDAVMKNCTITDNYAKQDGGAVYQLNGSDLTMTDCTITGNTAGRQGGAIWTRSPSHLINCAISNNTAGTEGGGICTGAIGTSNMRFPVMKMQNCTLENNTAGTQGGGMYLAGGFWIETDGLTLKGNTSKLEGSAIWVVDESTFTNLTVTGNTSENGGYAVYYGDSGFDGLSYIRGLHKIGGQMIVKDNKGGDLYLGEQTTLAIGEEGLIGDSEMHVKLDSGLLTQRIYGAYDYEGGNCEYVVTAGNKSQTNPEFDASMLSQTEEPIEAPTETPTGEDEQNAGKKVSPVILIAGGAMAAVIAAVAIIIVAVSKKKKTVSDK